MSIFGITKKKVKRMADINETLAERGSKYGEFRDNACVTQVVINILGAMPGWRAMTNMQREATHMIVHKLSRAVCGDPSHVDNFVDIAGYAQLVAKEMQND